MQKRNNPTSYRRKLKDRILKTAMQEFKQKGIRNVRMDDISSIMGISKRTLYEIYANKEELLLAGLMEEDAQRKAALMEFTEKSEHTVMDILLKKYNNDLKELTATNPLFFSELEQYPLIMKYLTTQTTQQQSEVFEFMKRGIDEGYFLPFFDYDIVVKFLRSSIHTMMTGQQFKKYDVNHIYRNVAVLLLRGFCTQKGINMIDEQMGIA